MTSTERAPGDRPARRRQRGDAVQAAAGTASRHYHHGDLRAALLAAAEQELAEKGVEGFTLRGCARRAGVSHAAPAHHFKDVRALLTAVATAGFDRLSASMEARAEGTEPGTVDHVVATGRGYVAFALANPAAFHLLFRTASLDRADPGYQAAGARAFSYPVRGIGALRGSDDPMADPRLAAEVIGIWSVVHGLSGLMLAGQLDRQAGGDREALADTLVSAMLRQFLAGGGDDNKKRRRG